MTIKINPNVKAFFSKAGAKALAVSGRLGNQKHMTVIRDAFAILVPLAIAAGFAILMRTFVFGAGSQSTSIVGWIGFATGDTIKNPGIAMGIPGDEWMFRANSSIAIASSFGNFMFYSISQAFVPVVSIYLAFAVAYLLSQARGNQFPILTGFIGTGAFIASTFGKPGLFGAQGMLAAIIISMLASEATTWLSKQKRLTIKLPDGVPPAVARSFARLLPALIVLLGVAVLNLPFMLIAFFTKTTPPSAGGFTEFGFADAIYAGVQAPFVTFASSPDTGIGLAIIYVLAATLLWFFGLHGTNVLAGIFNPVYSIVLFNNLAGTSKSIFTGVTFDAYIWFGGAGTTLGLVVALLIFARKGTVEREVAKLSVGPAIFNINEPLVYGLPLVLNVKWVVPFILTPIVLVITTYLGHTWVDITVTKYTLPWATPPIIGALLATSLDWRAIILAIINLIIAFLIYLPFAIFWTRKHVNGGQQVAAEQNANPVAAPIQTSVAAPKKRATVKGDA